MTRNDALKLMKTMHVIPEKYIEMMSRATMITGNKYDYDYPGYTLLIKMKEGDSIEDLRKECEDIVEWALNSGCEAKLLECPTKYDDDAALVLITDPRMRYLEQYIPEN